MGNIKSNLLEDIINEEEITLALEQFVAYGILLKSKKGGQDTYMENPDFIKLSKKEQDKVFKKIEKSKMFNPSQRVNE